MIGKPELTPSKKPILGDGSRRPEGFEDGQEIEPVFIEAPFKHSPCKASLSTETDLEEEESTLALILLHLWLAVEVDAIDSEDHSLIELAGDMLVECLVTELR